jgi:hypothetical protein
MSTLSRRRVAAVIGVVVAAVGALGAWGVNSSAQAVPDGTHILVIRLAAPAQSIWVIGSSESVVSPIKQGFCMTGPFLGGPLTTPYLVRNLSIVTINAFNSRDCGDGYEAGLHAQVPSNDGNFYFTVDVNN